MPMSRVIRTVASTCLVLALAACREAEDPNVIHLNGRIEATMVDLAPKVTGRVIEVRVREGDKDSAAARIILEQWLAEQTGTKASA